jgi:hypothetical protein
MGQLKFKCHSGGSVSEEKEVVRKREAARPFLLVPGPSSERWRAVGVLLQRGYGRDYLAQWGRVQDGAEPVPVPWAEEEELGGERVEVRIAEPDEWAWRTTTGVGTLRLLLTVRSPACPVGGRTADHPGSVSHRRIIGRRQRRGRQ